MAIKNNVLREIKFDHLWSVREDLHARFDGLVEPETVDRVLDAIAANRDSKVTLFSKIFIDREATAALQSIAGTVDSGLLDFIALNRGGMAA